RRADPDGGAGDVTHVKSDAGNPSASRICAATAREGTPAGSYAARGRRSTRTTNTMTAAASSMWMRPPIVYEVNIPSIHNAIKTTRSVVIMLTFLSCV